MSPVQLLELSAYWFSTNLHWMALLVILMPRQMEEIAPQSKSQAMGIVIGTGALLSALVPAIVGGLSDRCMSRWGRRRPYIAVGVTVNLAGLLILWYAGSILSLWLYLAGYLVVQLGNGTASGAYSGVIPDLVIENQRGEASGYMAALSQSGNILGAFGGGLLMKGGHITAGYAAIAITLILGLGVTLVGVKEHPLTVSPPAVDWRAFFKRFWIDPRLYPDFAWVWVTRALVTLGIWFVEPQIQYYLEDVVHVKNPGQTAGYLLGTMLIGATITGVLGGKLSDTIGRKKVVYIANGTTAVMAVAFCFGHTLAYTFVVGLIFGLGFGAYYSVDWALGCDVLPNKEDAAKDMGIWHISMVLPQSFAPALAAAILSAFPHHLSSGPSGQVVHYSLAGYIALFCLTALFLTLGAVFLRNVRGVR